ncbi:MAG TPA: nuclear transport factor 2 family protein [Pseudonocardia sp.]|nr:nuclear transport factor 2 family protein [Pseudonocardia sp.]
MTEQALETSAVAVVARLVDAVSRMDADALRAVLHPDVVVIEPEGLPYGGVYRGADAFFGELLPALAGPFELVVDDVQLFDGGSAGASRMTAVYTSRRTGETIRMPYVEVYDVVDGLVTRVDVYPQDVTALTLWMDANR